MSEDPSQSLNICCSEPCFLDSFLEGAPSLALGSSLGWQILPWPFCGLSSMASCMQFWVSHRRSKLSRNVEWWQKRGHHRVKVWWALSAMKTRQSRASCYHQLRAPNSSLTLCYRLAYHEISKSNRIVCITMAITHTKIFEMSQCYKGSTKWDTCRRYLINVCRSEFYRIL